MASVHLPGSLVDSKGIASLSFPDTIANPPPKAKILCDVGRDVTTERERTPQIFQPTKVQFGEIKLMQCNALSST